MPYQQAQVPVPVPPSLPIPIDPIIETILEILGWEVARRVLRPPSQEVPRPQDKTVREGPARPTSLDLHHYVEPFDVTEELAENRLFESLWEDDCGCHSRR